MPQKLTVCVLMFNLEMTCVILLVPIEQYVFALLLNLVMRHIVELEIYVKKQTFAIVPDSSLLKIERWNVLLPLELAMGMLNVLVLLCLSGTPDVLKMVVNLPLSALIATL